MLAQLNIKNVRDLEDLIIESIYAGNTMMPSLNLIKSLHLIFQHLNFFLNTVFQM